MPVATVIAERFFSALIGIVGGIRALFFLCLAVAFFVDGHLAKRSLGGALEEARAEANGYGSQLVEAQTLLSMANDANKRLVEQCTLQVTHEQKARRQIELRRAAVERDLRAALDEIRRLKREDANFDLWASSAVPVDAVRLLSQSGAPVSD